MIENNENFSTDIELSLNKKNECAKKLRENFKSKHEKLKIKGTSPMQRANGLKVPTPLKFLSIVVTIYMIITAILYILTYMGIPIMAI
jgi:hypothetical protein